VACLEILEHNLKLTARFGGIKRHHFSDEALGTAAAIARPGKMERADHNPGRIGVQPQCMVK